MSVNSKTTAAFSSLLMISAMSANAAQWRSEPFASGSLIYDDNVRFSTNNTESSAGGTVDVGISLVNESEVTKTVVQPRASFRGFPSESDLNSADQFLDFKTSLKGERTQLGFVIKLARDSAVSTELEDTGVVNSAIRRNSLRVNPFWEYRFSAIHSLEFGSNFRSVDWDDKEGSGLEDNDINETFAKYKRRLSDHDDLSVRFYQTDFESPETGFDSTTTGIEAGFVRRFTETNRFELGLGGWNADLTNPDSSTESDSGGSLSAAVVHHDETKIYRIAASQLVVPSSSGQVRQDRRLDFYVDYKINPRMHWGVNGVYMQSEKIGLQSIDRDRDYITVRPFLAWEWKPKLTISSSFRLSTQDFKDTGESSDRNELLLTLTYGKPQIAY